MQLRDKPLVELRGMAQAFGVTDIFEKDATQLAQEIELRRDRMAQDAAPKLPERPVYDARLMVTHRDKKSAPNDITALLEPHISMGLKLRFDDERWYMAWGERNDEGTLRMPLRHVLDCAERIMRGKRR
jgi:hypothetical protein